jgi:hypothetical protein
MLSPPAHATVPHPAERNLKRMCSQAVGAGLFTEGNSEELGAALCVCVCVLKHTCTMGDGAVGRQAVVCVPRRSLGVPCTGSVCRQGVKQEGAVAVALTCFCPRKQWVVQASAGVVGFQSSSEWLDEASVPAGRHHITVQVLLHFSPSICGNRLADQGQQCCPWRKHWPFRSKSSSVLGRPGQWGTAQ